MALEAFEEVRRLDPKNSEAESVITKLRDLDKLLLIKGRKVGLFISYAVDEDSKRFKIPWLAKALEQKFETIRVYYCEGWDGYPEGSIMDWMHSSIRAASFFIPVCTQAWKSSKDCRTERDIAYENSEHLTIIPLFEEVSQVPDNWKKNWGVPIGDPITDQQLDEIYNKILRGGIKS